MVCIHNDPKLISALEFSKGVVYGDESSSSALWEKMWNAIWFRGLVLQPLKFSEFECSKPTSPPTVSISSWLVIRGALIVCSYYGPSSCELAHHATFSSDSRPRVGPVMLVDVDS